MNDHFGSSDAQTQFINNEAEMQEQPWKDDVDEEERDGPSDCEKHESRPLFLLIADMLTNVLTKCC